MSKIKVSFLNGKEAIDPNEFTKDVEIELFQKFYDSLPTDSYLKGYFKGLASEVEFNIRSDFWYVPVEIIAELTSKHEGSIKEVEILKELNKKILKDAEKSIDHLNDSNTILQSEIQELRRCLEIKSRRVEELAEENERLSIDAKSYKALYDLEIMELKAKLYDASQKIILRKVI